MIINIKCKKLLSLENFALNKMSLLFSIISRENIVLCKYADCIGNFTEVTENLISNILLTNHKMTYTHGSFLFHYICEDRMIYMCISDENFPRARAFHFLSEIKLKFLSTYGLTAATAPANAMNKEFARVMALEMRKCNDKSEYDNLTRAEEEIAEIKGIMVKNIEKVVARGEQLDLLVIKSADLSDSVGIRLLIYLK